MHRISPHRQWRRGFTLIEILVSIAVLTLLTVTVAQVVSSTGNLTANSRRRMEADGQARETFDRIAADLSTMMLRPDVDYVFYKSTGNDKMFFYSEMPAYFAGAPDRQARSPVSLVGYRISTALQLERLGKGLTWTGAANAEQGGGPVFLTYPTPIASPSPTVTPTPTPYPQTTLTGNWGAIIGSAGGSYDDGNSDDYRVLATGIFRLEYCFLLKDGTLSERVYTKSFITANTPPAVATRGLKDVSAVIVAIAILDETARQRVTDTSRMVSALADFSGTALPAASTKLMATTWQGAINDGSFASASGLPRSAVSAVRIYQRYFYLNTK